MPAMNGWDFLIEYSKLDMDIKNRAKVIMLSTSDHTVDRVKAEQWHASDYIIKPLTKTKLQSIVAKYFVSV
jgi:DNA-binding response OmpR family regulator